MIIHVLHQDTSTQHLTTGYLAGRLDSITPSNPTQRSTNEHGIYVYFLMNHIGTPHQRMAHDENTNSLHSSLHPTR